MQPFRIDRQHRIGVFPIQHLLGNCVQVPMAPLAKCSQIVRRVILFGAWNTFPHPVNMVEMDALGTPALNALPSVTVKHRLSVPAVVVVLPRDSSVSSHLVGIPGEPAPRRFNAVSRRAIWTPRLDASSVGKQAIALHASQRRALWRHAAQRSQPSKVVDVATPLVGGVTRSTNNVVVRGRNEQPFTHDTGAFGDRLSHSSQSNLLLNRGQ